MDSSAPVVETSPLVLIFDGDDTLWSAEPLYDSAREQAGQVVAKEGLNAERWDNLQRQLDVALVAELGLSANRFPASNVAAYQRLAFEAGRTPDERVSEAIASIAKSVFSTRAELMPGVGIIIPRLASRFRLGLITRGEQWVQHRRVRESGLAHHFGYVDVVEVKRSNEFLRAVNHFQVASSQAWSIGNSMASDIQPALDAGLQAVWIDAHVWEYERQRSVDERRPFHRATDVWELPNLLGVEEASY